jgi:phosphate starvation-inducible PhoH-like protein
MFLTRIGIGARAVVTGDLTQVDLPRGQRSGLREARDVLAHVRGIAFTEFGKEDVVRHPLVARIVEAYDQQAARRLAEGEASSEDNTHAQDRRDRRPG